ncbi:MAG: hypothetical protein DWQ29_22695, partial [Planctomycetota bacterium]
ATKNTKRPSAASARNPTGDESTASGEAAKAWSRERKLMENIPLTNEVSRERGGSNLSTGPVLSNDASRSPLWTRHTAHRW